LRAVTTIVVGVILGAAVWSPSSFAADKERATRASIPEMPWLDDKDGTRLELIERLLTQRMPDPALSLVTDLRNEGMNKPVLDLFQGLALQQQGLTSQAEHLLVSARKKLPGDARPSANLCVLYADIDQYDEALSSCRRATTIDKKNPSAWNNYGYLLLFASDRHDEALDALEKAVSLDSTNERYRNNLGHAQVANGTPEEALRTFMSTATRGDAAYNVAVSLERFGESEDAILYYEQAIQTEEKHTLALEALARLSTSPEDL
jgi:tetratricopeptide (TPR) repeat protein